MCVQSSRCTVVQVVLALTDIWPLGRRRGGERKLSLMTTVSTVGSVSNLHCWLNKRGCHIFLKPSVVGALKFSICVRLNLEQALHAPLALNKLPSFSVFPHIAFFSFGRCKMEGENGGTLIIDAFVFLFFLYLGYLCHMWRNNIAGFSSIPYSKMIILN